MASYSSLVKQGTWNITCCSIGYVEQVSVHWDGQFGSEAKRDESSTG